MGSGRRAWRTSLLVTASVFSNTSVEAEVFDKRTQELIWEDSLEVLGYWENCRVAGGEEWKYIKEERFEGSSVELVCTALREVRITTAVKHSRVRVGDQTTL